MALSPTPRSRLRRRVARGSHDRGVIDAILDEALVCHVGVVADGAPVVLPTAFVRIDDHLYVHGAVANAALGALCTDSGGCVTVTLLDGLVLARSAFHHSMNYRSVVLFGRGERVTDPGEQRTVLAGLVDRMAPGRSDACRPPTPEELRATLVVRFPIREGSAKVRTGGPIDDAEDYALDHWAGVVPVRLVRGEPQRDEATAPPVVTSGLVT
ncbi:MAG: pyridoxamine 5'-phosphate oxidase family protein [Acidimicrobiia bacterium]|nr:pyridoxamine 5'-phosphate oxidase family protein [Acidimicrobiia bacterium]